MKRRSFLNGIVASCAGALGLVFTGLSSRAGGRTAVAPGVGPGSHTHDLTSKGTLEERFHHVSQKREAARDELIAMEDLVRKDGYTIEKLSKKELLGLLQDKQVESGKELSESALHLLVAGRCAGSEGCSDRPPPVERAPSVKPRKLT